MRESNSVIGAGYPEALRAIRDVERFEALLPTDADIDDYKRRGWWTSEALLTSEELGEIEEAIRRHQSGVRDRALPAAIKPYLDWREGNPRDLKINDYVAYQSSVVLQIALKPIIGAIAARLSGCDLVRLFNSSYVEKEAAESGDAGRVGWHTDKAYWKTCTSDRMLTAWIPLHNVTEECGTLLVLDGSHLWTGDEPLASLQREKNFLCSDHAALERRIAELGRPTRVTALNLKQGQVSFHHCMTFHGSGPNRSRRPRKALILHLQDRENRYREVCENGKRVEYNNDMMVRKLANGDPDYADPFFCPVIWPARASEVSL
jgi:hypothetical protein